MPTLVDESTVRATAADKRRGSILQLSLAEYGHVFLGLLTTPLQARVLGPAGRGELAALMSYSALLALFLGMGLPMAVKRFAATYPERRDDILRTALRAVRWLPLAAVAISLVLFAGPLAGLSPTARIAGFLLFSLTPLTVVTNCFYNRLTAESALRPVTIMRASPLVLPFVTVGLFLLGLLNVVSLLILFQLGIVIEMTIGWRATRFRGFRKPKRSGAGDPETSYRSLARFGVKGMLGGVAEHSNLRLDQAILISLVPAAALGQYAIAATTAMLPTLLSHVISKRFFGSIGAASPEDRAPAIERPVRLTFLVVSIACLGLALLTPLAIPLLYGPGFADVVPLTLLLLPGTVALATANVAGTALVAVGRPLAYTAAQLAGTVVVIIGIVPVARTFGTAGVAVLSGITYLATLAVILANLRKEGVRRILPGRGELRELTAMVRLAATNISKFRPARPAASSRLLTQTSDWKVS